MKRNLLKAALVFMMVMAVIGTAVSVNAKSLSESFYCGTYLNWSGVNYSKTCYAGTSGYYGTRHYVRAMIGNWKDTGRVYGSYDVYATTTTSMVNSRYCTIPTGTAYYGY